jgi:hypothetical protein
MDSFASRALFHGHHHVSEAPAAYGDVRPTVYLDTTIPSYLAPRSRQDLLSVRRQRITRVWWERHSARYELRVSYRVVEEASAGDPLIAAARVRILAPIELLDSDQRSDALIAHLIGDGLLPPRASADAEHIAIAAVHSVRYLLTWNYKHIANPNIARGIVRKCERFGFACPEICTPEQLMRTYAHERSNHQ